MNWLKNLYEYALKKCESKYAVYFLAISSFTESCIFILPPEVLLIPMSFANRKKAIFYWIVTVITSVLGAIAGYYIGAVLWDVVQYPLFEYMPGFEKYFTKVGGLYQENVYTTLFIAAFTPIPFKVFTVVAGVYHELIPIGLLIGISFIGRGLRYLILVVAILIFGEKVKKLLEERFGLMTMVLGLLAVLALIAYKSLKAH